MILIPSITLSDTKVAANETATVTITFVDNNAPNLTLADLSASHGTLTNLTREDSEGFTWKATFSPTAGANSDNSVVTLNSNTYGQASSNAFTVDTIRPGVTLSMLDRTITTGETTVVTLAFSEKVRGMSDGRVTVENGSLSSFITADDGMTWTSTFTPNANTPSVESQLYINSVSGITDLAGNTVSNVGSGGYYTVDTTGPAPRPTAIVSMPDTTLSSGETGAFSITFSEAVRNFEPADISVGGGVLTALNSSDEGRTWQGSITPTADVESTGNAISVNLAGVTGVTSNLAGTGTASSAQYKVDTKAPTATISVVDDVITASETSLVKIVFSEAVTGLTTEDFQVEGGTLSNLVPSDEGIGVRWSATFTPTPGTQGGGQHITLNNGAYTDLAGNAGSGVTTSNAYMIDNVAPTVSVSISDGNDGNITTGETAVVTVHFSEKVVGMSDGRVSYHSGALSSFTTADDGMTWTSTFTPNANTPSSYGQIYMNDISGITDLAGNAVMSPGAGGYYTVDTTGPAPGPTAIVSMPDSTLSSGETGAFSITFSEAVRDFDASDISVGGGAVTALNSSDEGRTWQGTITPTADSESTGNTISVNLAGVTGYVTGNAGTGIASSSQYKVDTKAPTATIAVIDDVLTANETSQVKIVFSEAVAGLSTEDFQVEGGTLSNLVPSDEGLGIRWSATFTPSAGVEGSNKHISLINTGFTDLAGNLGAGVTKSNAYTVDTVAPTASVTMLDTTLTTGETTTVTVAYSEAVTGMGNVLASNGTLSAFTAGADGKTWTATFTPSANLVSQMNILDLNVSGVTDLAGNAAVLTHSSGYYSIDTTIPLTGPTATVDIGSTALGKGMSTGFSISFSEAVRNFDLADIKAGSGVVSDLMSHDEGLTWQGKLTPGAGVETIGNVISVDLAGVTGYRSGLAGTGSANSTMYKVDTKAPSAAITLSDANLTTGETALVTIAFSERVTGFDATDLSVANGTLGNLTSSDEGLTWSAAFTPTADLRADSNVVSLDLSGLTDFMGNAGSGIVASSNYTIDTVPTQTETKLVDGVSIVKQTGTAADGSAIQMVVIPTVTAGRVNQDGSLGLADIPLVNGADGRALLQVGVPVGFGVTASGASQAHAAGQSLADLITAIQAHTVTGSAVQQSMVGGGSGFLGQLDANAPLLVQTIVVNGAGNTGSTGTGNLLTISGATGNNVPQTALVIDASGVPSGTSIVLNNVSFAAVIGDVKLTGGDGAQTIFGDAGNQTIILGADDDVLHGGAGNDTVGSGAGNDRIYGDEGDDLVFGGLGDDYIDGGTGHDTVQLVGASRADYTMRVADGKLVMSHRNGGADGTDVVTNVETLRFTGGTAPVDVHFRDTDVASLIRMYDTAFGRNPDEAGLNFWIARSEDGVSLIDIAKAMMSSTEAQARYQGMSNEAYIHTLYQQGLDRTGTATEAQWWIDGMNSGVVSRGAALYGFAESAEQIALVGMMDTSITTI